MASSDGAAGASEGDGCAAFVLVVVVIAIVVAAVISIAALVDPFSLLPPITEIWEDCEESLGGSECDLHERYPGFWWHVVVNFAYVAITTALLVALVAATADLRTARAERFADANAAERYRDAREALASMAALTAVPSVLPLIVAVA